MKPSRLGLLTAAGAAAVGAMILTAPLANAIPEHTIQSECDLANHGTYTTSLVGNSRFSSCCYTDIKGTKYCDYYLDGVFEGTGPGVAKQPPPTTGSSGPLGGSHPKPSGASRPVPSSVNAGVNPPSEIQ